MYKTLWFGLHKKYRFELTTVLDKRLGLINVYFCNEPNFVGNSDGSSGLASKLNEQAKQVSSGFYSDKGRTCIKASHLSQLLESQDPQVQAFVAKFIQTSDPLFGIKIEVVNENNHEESVTNNDAPPYQDVANCQNYIGRLFTNNAPVLEVIKKVKSTIVPEAELPAEIKKHL